eukprot:COSAG02_NODE_1432_length_12646_cov_3.566988_17_plen_175_part_00
MLPRPLCYFNPSSSSLTPLYLSTVSRSRASQTFSHRAMHWQGVSVATSCLSLLCALSTAQSANPKHILFLMIDDLGYNDVRSKCLASPTVLDEHVAWIALSATPGVFQALISEGACWPSRCPTAIRPTSVRPILMGWRWRGCAWSDTTRTISARRRAPAFFLDATRLHYRCRAA